jgi:beta-phosphoglucomutase family hydrolase
MAAPSLFPRRRPPRADPAARDLTTPRISGVVKFTFCREEALIEGAIFDMDGVLVDNLAYHVSAWQQLGREQGVSLESDQIRRHFGQRNREIIAGLMPGRFTADDIPKLAARKEALYRAVIASELRPVAGLAAFLQALRQEKVRSAVATSACLENTNMVLDGLRIRPYFDAVVTGPDVTCSKPDPEIFLLAALRLGASPANCVVFEDSFSGIEAAKRAGCACVALATTHSTDELLTLHPDRVIPDFRAIAVQEFHRLRKI